MKNQGQIVIGSLIALLGILLLADNFLNIDIGRLIFPAILIGLGIWVITRPRMVEPDTEPHFTLLGDLERSGQFEAKNEEFWVFVGDIDLDYTKSQFPENNLRVRVYGFVADIELRIPPEVGVSLTSDGFVVNTKINGQKKEVVISGQKWQSPNYESAARKMDIQTAFFVSDVKIIQV